MISKYALFFIYLCLSFDQRLFETTSSSLSETIANSTRLSDQLNAARTDLEQERMANTQLQKNLETLTDKFAPFSLHALYSLFSLKQMKIESESLQKRNLELTQLTDELTALHKEELSKQKKVLLDKKQLETSLDSLHQKSEQFSTLTSSLTATVTSLKTERDKCSSVLQELQEQHSHCNEQISVLRTQLENTKKELQVKVTALETERTHFSELLADRETELKKKVCTSL